MDRECQSSSARYGMVLDASLITGIDPPHEVESALAAINTAYNSVSSDISRAQASADMTIVQSRRAVEIETLKAQAEAHLGIQLDKTEQRSDWSRRPLSQEQLRYAALDAVCTLWLYEKQLSRGLRGDYELRARQEPPSDHLPLFAPNEVTAAAPSVIPPVVSPVRPPTARPAPSRCLRPWPAACGRGRSRWRASRRPGPAGPGSGAPWCVGRASSRSPAHQSR